MQTLAAPPVGAVRVCGVRPARARRSLRRACGQSGRPERLSPAALPVWHAVIRAGAGNRGLVYLGDASVGTGDPGLAPGCVLGLRGDPWLDLAQVYVMADTGGDGVEVMFACYA